jgi:hypothetical protein
MERKLFPLAAALLGCAVLRSDAGVIILDTGKSLSLAPSSSGSITFSALNGPGDISNNFLAWTLGIQLRPAGTTTGSLTLGTLTQPVSNPMPIGANPDRIQPTLLTLANSASINGSVNFYQIGIQTTVALGTLTGNADYNLGTLSISSSANASGTWNLYAVTQGGASYQSYWTDGSLVDSDFGNLPRGAGNSSLLIGTVSITAVPEPAFTWVMGGCLAVYFLLKRQGRAVFFWR